MMSHDIENQPDIALIILEFLNDPKELFQSVSTVSKQFNLFANTNTLWLAYYKSSFGEPPPVKNGDEYKNQYIAEYLYRRASSNKQLALTYYLFSKLKTFLEKHNKSWSYYYLGLLYYHGQGTAQDKKKGIHYLLRAIHENHSKAAQTFCELFSECYLEDDKALLKQAMQQLKKSGQLVKLLLTYHENIQPIDGLIGLTYYHGINIPQDMNKALNWLQQAINKGDTKTILQQGFALLKNPLNAKSEDIQNALDFLIASFQAHPHPLIAKEIGSIYKYFNELDPDNKQALKWLNHAYLNGVAQAGTEMESLLIKNAATNEEIRICKNRLADAFYQGDHQAGVKLAELYLDDKEFEKAEAWLRASFKDGNIEAALKLSEGYCNNPLDICDNPDIVWWLQISAQFDNQEALHFLENAAIQGHPYAACALSLLPILSSSRSKLNLQVDETYFNEYIEAGIMEEIVTPDMKKALHLRLPPFSSRNACAP